MSRWFDVTSGWVLSAGIHLVLLLGAGLVCVEQLASFDDDGGLRIGIRSVLSMEGDGSLPRTADRILYGRLVMPDQKREKSELFEKDGTSLVWTSNEYGPGAADTGGNECAFCDDPCAWCGFCGFSIPPDSFKIRSAPRPRTSYARSRFETSRGCSTLSPLPLRAGDLALLSFLGGLNALPLGLSSVR